MVEPGNPNLPYRSPAHRLAPNQFQAYCPREDGRGQGVCAFTPAAGVMPASRLCPVCGVRLRIGAVDLNGELHDYVMA